MKLISLVIFASSELVLSAPVSKPRAPMGNANPFNIASNNFNRLAVGNGLANLDTLFVKRQALVAKSTNGNGNGSVGNNGNGETGNGNGNGNGEGLDNSESVNIASGIDDHHAVGIGAFNLKNIVV
jgi:hypothetical protein